MPAVAGSVFRSVSSRGGDVVVVFFVHLPQVFSGDADIAGGVRFVAAGNFTCPYALRICHFLHRLPVDAMGSRAGHGVLRGWNRLGPLYVGSVPYLLRHGATDAGKRHSCMESFVKGKDGPQRERDTERIELRGEDLSKQQCFRAYCFSWQHIGTN